MSVAENQQAAGAKGPKPSSRRATPPGPSGRFGGWNNLRAIRSDFRVFSHASHQAFGDVLSYGVLGQRVYQFATPDLAYEVLVTKAKQLRKPDNQKRAFARIIGCNLFTSDGDAWIARRRMLAPVFQPQVIDRYREIVIRQAAETWDRVGEGVVNLSRGANTIALLSVAEALFGAAVHSRVDEFLDVAARLQGAVSRQILSPVLVPLWIPTPDNRTVRTSLKFFHDMIGALVAERRRSPENHADLLAALLRATDAESGTRLTDREATDEALTILLAGSDTTAAALSWSAFLLAKHPRVQDQLRAEVRQICGGGQIQEQDTPNLRLATQVFQEAMRLYPPAVAIARQAAESVEIGGWQVPRGALVFVSVYSIHHDARWFPEPEQFEPGRFAASNSDALTERSFLPFGLGPRACIGQRFAMMEGTIVLAELVRRYELTLLDPQQSPELETQLSLHPRGGLSLRLKRI